jgi:predicted N-acyltransferase
MPLDLAMLAGGILHRVGTAARGIFPNALKYQAIFCGLPVSAGQSQLAFAQQANTPGCLEALVAKMTELARHSGARFLIFKELDDSAAEAAQVLGQLGFFRGESPPMNHFPTRFASFGEYLAALKAPYRSKIVRSQRKMRKFDLRVERLTNSELIPRRFTTAAHQMYLDVVAKSPIRLETLSREWFVEMATQFQPESRWTALYERDQLIAWAYGLLTDGVYHSLFGGVDYRRNAETDAYFNLLYEEMDFVLSAGVHDIQLGQTADDFKSRLGATQSRRWFFIKPLRWKAQTVLRLAAKHVLPSYPPPTERHVFHAEDQAGIVRNSRSSTGG